MVIHSMILKPDPCSPVQLLPCSRADDRKLTSNYEPQINLKLTLPAFDSQTNWSMLNTCNILFC